MGWLGLMASRSNSGLTMANHVSRSLCVLQFLASLPGIKSDWAKTHYLQAWADHMRLVRPQVRALAPGKPRDLHLLPRRVVIWAWQVLLQRRLEAVVGSQLRRDGCISVGAAALMRDVLLISLLLNYIPPSRITTVITFQVLC